VTQEAQASLGLIRVADGQRDPAGQREQAGRIDSRAGRARGGQDVSVTIEHNVASGSFSVNRYTVRGTHTASGRHYEVTGMDMIRVRDGKLAEHWAVLDSTAMRHQLGLR
jgi:ketosteroid isomerase-like protein